MTRTIKVLDGKIKDNCFLQSKITPSVRPSDDQFHTCLLSYLPNNNMWKLPGPPGGTFLKTLGFISHIHLGKISSRECSETWKTGQLLKAPQGFLFVQSTRSEGSGRALVNWNAHPNKTSWNNPIFFFSDVKASLSPFQCENTTRFSSNPCSARANLCQH